MWVGLSGGRSTPWIRGISPVLLRLALALLVSRVRANDADHALAADELTLVAHPPDARSYLHDGSGPVRREVGRIYCMGRVNAGKTLYGDTQTGLGVLNARAGLPRTGGPRVLTHSYSSR